jgi:hypothetical protein
MKKSLFTAFAVGLGLTANLMAQVPSYVPSNGLVGWWPFNGNANDESGNGNNGTVNGATLTADRFGVANKAYSFDGVSNEIVVPHDVTLNSLPISISLWFRTSISQANKMLVNKYVCQSQNGYSFRLNNNKPSAFYFSNGQSNNYLSLDAVSTNFQSLNDDIWHNGILIVESDSSKLYIDGNLIHSDAVIGSLTVTNTNTDLRFGNYPQGVCTGPQNFYYSGLIDDIGIWNRALTQDEITALYNGCSSNGISLQPANVSTSAGTNTQFTVNASSGAIYQWQTDLGLGFQNLSNAGQYSGVSSNTLTVSNVSNTNNNQQFRCIVNNGSCSDTSNVAVLMVSTLGISELVDQSSLIIFPNPTNDRITIDAGNLETIKGYSIKIEDVLGQQVFQSAINQQQFNVDLRTWSGNGLYFVHLIDPQNNTVTVRKIVLQ